MLNDRHFRRLGEFTRRVAETVLRHDGIRIDNQNDLPDPDRPPVRSPGSPPLAALPPRLLNRQLQRAILKTHSHPHATTRSILFTPPRRRRRRQRRRRLLVPINLTGSFQRSKVSLQLQTQLKPIIHIRRLLEPARAREPIRVRRLVVRVRRPGDPADVVIRVERDSLRPFGLRERLQSVVVHEDGRGSALPGVRLHCLFE